MMTPVSLKPPFQARSSWGWKSKRWDESSAVREGGEKWQEESLLRLHFGTERGFWIALDCDPALAPFLYRISERQMGLAPVRGAGAGTRIRSQLHLKPSKGKKRRRDRKREPMSSNCQMVNIFAPFQRRINCRAAQGLRRTDQCGRGSWPWLSPLRLPPQWVRWGSEEGRWGVLQQLLTQSFAYQATWASTLLGFYWRRRWGGRVEGLWGVREGKARGMWWG